MAHPKRYTPNAAYQYKRNIVGLSSHCSQEEGRNIDIYAIQDIDLLSEISQKYRDGIYRDKGYKRSGAYRAAIKQFENYVRHLHGHSVSSPFESRPISDENVTLEFLAQFIHYMQDEMLGVRKEMAEFRDEMRLQTSIILRLDHRDTRREERDADLRDRLRALEERVRALEAER